MAVHDTSRGGVETRPIRMRPVWLIMLQAPNEDNRPDLRGDYAIGAVGPRARSTETATGLQVAWSIAGCVKARARGRREDAS